MAGRAVYRTVASPICPAVKITHTSGAVQRRPGALSISRKEPSRNAEVPVWSGCSSGIDTPALVSTAASTATTTPARANLAAPWLSETARPTARTAATK